MVIGFVKPERVAGERKSQISGEVSFDVPNSSILQTLLQLHKLRSRHVKNSTFHHSHSHNIYIEQVFHHQTNTMEGSRKRKLPARATRQSEAPSKRRISTPPEPRAQPTPPPQPEDTLPTSIVASKPLPTVDEPQPDNLSNTEYQTISER